MKNKILLLLLLIISSLSAQNEMHSVAEVKCSISGILCDGITRMPLSNSYVFALSPDKQKILGYTKTGNVKQTNGLKAGRWKIDNLKSVGDILIVGFYPETKFNMAIEREFISYLNKDAGYIYTKPPIPMDNPATGYNVGNSPLHILSLAGWIVNEITTANAKDEAIALADELLYNINNNEKYLKQVFNTIESGNTRNFFYLYEKYYIDPNSSQYWKKDWEWYDELRSLLSYAACKGNMAVVKFLITKGADVNKYDKSCYARSGSYPILNATIYNHFEIVKYLIQNGANINVSNGAGNTPLIYASTHGYYDIAKLLLENGADVNEYMEYGYSALYFASLHGNLEIVKLLIDFGAEINSSEDSALAEACYQGHFDVVKLLIENGADINAGYPNSKPIDQATKENHMKIVEYLKSKGAK